MGITNYSVHDAAAPPGGSVISLFALATMDHQDQWGTNGHYDGYGRNPRYMALKDEVERVLLARAERYLPGLAASIVHKETSTPLTNVRYSLNPSGAIYGFAQTVDQTVAGRLPARTPIENLFLAGAWTNPGGGMSAAMLSGVEAARLAQAYLDEAPVRSIFFSAAPDAVLEVEAADVVPLPATRPTTPAVVKPATPAGSAPEFALDVIGTTRKVRLADFAGRPLILLFNSAKTAEEASAINLRLRNNQPDHYALPIVTVVNLRGIPRPFRGIARGSMEKSYAEAVTAARQGFAARGVRPPADMTEVVCIAPDWDGKVVAAYRVGDLNQDAVAVLVGPDGAIVGQGRGAAEALALVGRLATTSS